MGETFETWLAKFIKGKEEVATIEDKGNNAVHSIHRYLEKETDCLWDIAFTYTGRLVVRSGKIGPDGVKVLWGDWETKHDVEVPKQR